MSWDDYEVDYSSMDIGLTKMTSIPKESPMLVKAQSYLVFSKEDLSKNQSEAI